MKKEKEIKMEVMLGDYRFVLKDVIANLIFTSPPYNIGSKAERRDGFRKFGRYDPKSYGGITEYSDTLPEDVYQDEQAHFVMWCADHLSRDGILVYNHKPRRKNKVLIHPMEWLCRSDVRRRMVLMEEIVWNRGSTHNHSNMMMWQTTERLYVMRKAGAKYRFKNTEVLPHRSDIWRINRAPSNGHDAPFPLELAQAVLLSWSHKGDLICDPYSGTGTTAVASLMTNREFIGAEINLHRQKIAMVSILEQRQREIAA